MNTISNGVYQPAQKLNPLSLLTQYVDRGTDGCLQIFSSGSAWFLHLEQGRLVYASDLTDPFGRLDRHLRLLSIQAPSLISAVRVQLRLMFEEMPTADQLSLQGDYRAIGWLVEQRHLSPEQAKTLIEAMAREVIGAFLPIQVGSHKLIEQDLLVDLPKFCQLDLRQMVADCQTQFQKRQSALSVYGQPLDRLSSRTRPDYSALGRDAEPTAEPDRASSDYSVDHDSGYRAEYHTEYHTERRIEQDTEYRTGYPIDYSSDPNLGIHAEPEIERTAPDHSAELAPQIAPPIRVTPAALIKPKLPSAPPAPAAPSESSYPQAASGIQPLNLTGPAVKPLTPQWFSNHVQAAPKPVVEVNTRTYTIACIDDSPAVLQAINSFLDDKSFSVVLISDPVKALMQIIRSRPDLILLDVTMPNLDGYELCSLLRKHPSFRGTPIVMVTGNTGFIDRAKAKLVGSSGYLTKPFTQADLMKVVFKHLS
jgi:two-component system, chemotaxis family, response regulator PixG